MRTTSATQAEKSTVQSRHLNSASSGGVSALDAAAAAARAQVDAAAQPHANATPATDIGFCAIDDPTCEACQ